MQVERLIWNSGTALAVLRVGSRGCWISEEKILEKSKKRL